VLVIEQYSGWSAQLDGSHVRFAIRRKPISRCKDQIHTQIGKRLCSLWMRQIPACYQR
jgi:hypothetical protein